MRVAGLDPGRKPRAAPLGEEEQAALLQGVRSWEAWLDACETSAPQGFIATQPAGAAISACQSRCGNEGAYQADGQIMNNHGMLCTLLSD